MGSGYQSHTDLFDELLLGEVCAVEVLLQDVALLLQSIVLLLLHRQLQQGHGQNGQTGSSLLGYWAWHSDDTTVLRYADRGPQTVPWTWRTIDITNFHAQCIQTYDPRAVSPPQDSLIPFLPTIAISSIPSRHPMNDTSLYVFSSCASSASIPSRSPLPLPYLVHVPRQLLRLAFERLRLLAVALLECVVLLLDGVQVNLHLEL